MNVSRDSLDGGGLATAHVVRVYTTDVLVVWPNDADHPKSEYPRGWFTQEDKEDLIFIKEDPSMVSCMEETSFGFIFSLRCRNSL